MSAEVDKFVSKLKQWPDEVAKLRELVLKSKLDESLKWRLPCYSHNGGNVVIIQPFKNFLALMFFKGTLLKDPKQVLVDNGPNSQAARRLEFRSLQDLKKLAPTIKAYLAEAIALEEAGAKVQFKKNPQTVPAELTTIFAKQPKLKKAFESLTPGRQRAYIFHFAGAKQAATRLARIKKFVPRILAGKGIND